jgi:D-3-phosphoglycerate dehydrogenase
VTRRIVFLGPEEGLEAVRELAGRRAEAVGAAPTEEAVAAALREADALLDASMRTRISDAMIEAAPRLTIISCATTGSDHIARAAAGRRGIPVRTLREDADLLRNITPAAELTWALLMACARRLVPAVQHVRDGKWRREDFPGMMLKGRTLGLVGCGRIGQWMARYAAAFGMPVIGCDPFVEPWPEGIERVDDLKALAARADVLSVHVHLSDATRGLVSAEVFAALKPGAIFLNTSRGAIADEAALLAALESGRLAAAGVDVLEGEPDIDAHPLVGYARRHDNLLITPHCGGFSPDAVRLVCRRAAEKILEHLDRRA